MQSRLTLCEQCINQVVQLVCSFYSFDGRILSPLLFVHFPPGLFLHLIIIVGRSRIFLPEGLAALIANLSYNRASSFYFCFYFRFFLLKGEVGNNFLTSCSASCCSLYFNFFLHKNLITSKGMQFTIINDFRVN